MDSETALVRKVESQLAELGYSELSILTNVKLPIGKIVDLLVVDNEQT
jgi:hypothetical protein